MRSLLKVLIAGVLLVVLAGAPAMAQDSGTYVGGAATEIDPQPQPVDPGAAGASVLPATLERDTGASAGTTLPVTGSDLAALAVVGLVLVAAGGAAIAVTRSRRPATA